MMLSKAHSIAMCTTVAPKVVNELFVPIHYKLYEDAYLITTSEISVKEELNAVDQGSCGTLS